MRAFFVTLLLLSAALAGAEDASAPLLIEFEIEDQLKAKHSHLEFADQVSVFLWADRDGSKEHMDRWKAALEEELAQEIEEQTLQLRGVAHVKGAPFFVKGKIRKRFGEDPERWTLLDWKGVFAENYDFGESHLVVLVFDREGALRHRQEVEDMEKVDVAETVAAARALSGGVAPN